MSEYCHATALCIRQNGASSTKKSSGRTEALLTIRFLERIKLCVA